MATQGSFSSSSASAQAILATPTTVYYGTEIKAASVNTTSVWIGILNTVTAGTTAATDGWEISPGQSVFIPKYILGDISLIYAIGTGSLYQVYYLGA